MNLKQLEVFYAIMQAGSVTAAARNLSVSQPAVSNVLKHAEQQLGFRLFERIRGRLHPTAEAAALLPDVSEIFGRIGTVNRVVQEMRDGRSGRLVVATSPTLIDAFLPQAIALLRQRNPGVQISIQSLPTPLAVERVARREADMGMVYAPITDSALEVEDFFVTEIACALPKLHPLAKRRYISPAMLHDQCVISLGPTTRLGTLIEEACRRSHIAPPTITIEASSSLAACLMAGESAGIALVDRVTSLPGRFAGLLFRPFRPRIGVSIKLIYPRDRPRPRAAVRLSEELRRTTRTVK